MNEKQRREFIAAAMARLGISQSQFAETLGIHQPNVSEMVQGVRDFKPYHVLAAECLLRRAGKPVPRVKGTNA